MIRYGRSGIKKVKENEVEGVYEPEPKMTPCEASRPRIFSLKGLSMGNLLSDLS